jgi:hypothetical protein
MSPRLEVEPDERSAELPARRSRQTWRALLLTLAVAALAGGSWWAGHGNKSAPQDISAVPEIHPDAAPVKEAPADRGGMVVPGQDSVLLNRDAKAKPEELLPPPEAVKPRPAPSSSAVAAAAPPPPMVPPAPTSIPVQQAPPPASAEATETGPPQAAAVAARPAAAPPPSSVTGAAYRLQLGALATEVAAKQEWLRLQKQNPDLLGKLSLTISRTDLGAKGVFYRIQAGPIADAAQAAQSCAALKSRKIGCILVKP